MHRVIKEQRLVQQAHRARVAAAGIQGVPVAGRRVSRPTRIEGLGAREARDARGSGGRGRTSGDGAHQRHHKGGRGKGSTHTGNRLPLAYDHFVPAPCLVCWPKRPPVPSPSGPAGSLAPVRILGGGSGRADARPVARSSPGRRIWVTRNRGIATFAPLPVCPPVLARRWQPSPVEIPTEACLPPLQPTLPPRCSLLLTRFSPGTAKNKHAS